MLFSLKVFVMIACAKSVALAGIDEVEPNDTPATAQLVPSNGAFISASFDGSLGPNDVDYYQVNLIGTNLLFVNIFDFTPAVLDDNDSILGLFDENGALVAFNDNAAFGTLSALVAVVPAPGTYFLAVSGAGDVNFVGDHDESFDYVLIFNTVPAPSAVCLMVGLACQRTRRSRAA
jgi:hypothetical protein